MLKEFTAVMTGGLGAAEHGQGGYLCMNNIIHIVILCIRALSLTMRVPTSILYSAHNFAKQ